MYFPCSVITNTQSMKKLIFMRQIGILGFDYWSAPLSIILRISSIFSCLLLGLISFSHGVLTLGFPIVKIIIQKK